MNNNSNKLKIIGLSIIIVALIALVIWFLKNLAFSFSTMLIIAILAIVAEFLFFMGHPKQNDSNDGKRVRFAIMLIGCFGILAVFAMKNYFYPGKEVFSNNDHHAIALEGIETSNPSLLLAADSEAAFFDDHTMAGSIELSDMLASDSTATLRIRGAGMPIYRLDTLDTSYFVALEGQDNIHSWDPGNQLELIGRNSETVAFVRVVYDDEFDLWHLKRKYLATYIIEYYGNDGAIHTDTSDYKRVIRRRYPLASLFPGIDVMHGVDFSKIELMRPRANVFNTNKDDKNLTVSPLLVSYCRDSGLGGIRSGNAQTAVGISNNLDIRLDGKTVYSIGLNNNIPEFRLTIDTLGNTAVRYRMPMYRYLTTEGYKEGENGYYTFMVASTLIENGEVNSQIPQNILLYDVFDNDDNRYQMRPQFVSFQRGNTRDSLELTVLNSQNGARTTVKAGEHLPFIGTADPGTHWIASLDNFRDPKQSRPIGVNAPLSSNNMMLFVLVVTLLCCLSLCFRVEYTHTYIEPIAYIILIALLSIRLVLLWRASVFPPASGISLAEFNKWRMTGGGLDLFTQIVIAGLLLVLIVLLFRNLFRIGGGNKSRCNWLNPQTWVARLNAYHRTFKRSRTDSAHSLLPQEKRVWVIGGWIGYVVLFLIALFSGKKPLFCVGLPVIWYFVVDFIINLQVGTRWTDHGNDSYAVFWQGVINMILASGVMFVLDGGYGIVFMVFCMLSMILRLIDIGEEYDLANEKGVRGIGILVLLLLIVVCLVFLRWAAIKLFIGGIGFFVVMAIAITVIGAVLIWTLYGKHQILKRIGIIAAVAFLLSVIAGVVVKYSSVSESHIANRVMVLADKPSEVLGRAKTTSNVTEFLNASLNDWVLEEYEQRGKEVSSVVGEHGRGYFKLQPHSNVGVSWGTQLTDLSVPRFVIAEQSWILPVLLIVLFFVMESVALFFPCDRRWARSLLIQIPLLLTVQSLLVWMAVTRRFVFVGQDFPMISLISKVNLYMSILELLAWNVVAILESTLLHLQSKDYNISVEERQEVRDLLEGKSSSKLYDYLKTAGKYSIAAILVVGAIIILGNPERHYNRNVYDVRDCVAATEKLITKSDANSVQDMFVAYQDSLINAANLNRSRRNHIHDISRIVPPKLALEEFCNHYGYNPDNKDPNNQISLVFAQDESYGSFAQASFDSFLKNKIRQDDIDQLIFLVKRRYVDSVGAENVRYSLDITSRYYRQQLPTRIDRSWRGSVTDEASLNGSFAGHIRVGDVDLYSIPASWTKSKVQSLIVRPTTNSLAVVGKNEPRQLRRGESYCLSEGEVLTGRNAPNLSEYGSGNYIARNVFVNSQPQFIYPMQDKFYWARPLAEQIRSYMNHAMNAAKDKPEAESIKDANSAVTLSIELTKDLVNAIDRNAPNGNVAVAVADGDGKIRALVEHRKPRYKLNPNNNRRIKFVEDSLKREGLLNFGKEAERFFSNKAILSLNNGPGSSQKPIVWTSVSTQYNGWDWNRLSMAGINNNLMREADADHYNATWFAGDSIPPNTNGSTIGFQSIKTDEGNGNSVDLRAYMRASSNYYNAIMVYLGSHTRAELDHGLPNDNPLFVSRDRLWLTRRDRRVYYCDSLFPLVDYAGSIYSFARPLQPQNIMTRGVLMDGLEENFGLPVSYAQVREQMRENYKSTYLHSSMLDRDMVANDNAFPEISYFYNEKRGGSREVLLREGNKVVARDGLKMTALGKNSVWMVSPVKMAEMYGKLMSFNRNYRLTIDPNMEKLPYLEFVADGGANAYLRMRNTQFMRGLNDVFVASGGTAHRLYDQIRGNLGNYFIYGKTGTIDGKEKGRKVEDHLLAVIITNRDLTQMNNVDDYQDLRFYVIYIADFAYQRDGFSWRSIDPVIINTVLTSKEFRHYMEGE